MRQTPWHTASLRNSRFLQCSHIATAGVKTATVLLLALVQANHVEHRPGEYIGYYLKQTLADTIKNWTRQASDLIQWSPSAGECPPLQVPLDGRLECSDGFNEKSRCKFTCNPGFIENGRRGRRCVCEDGRCWWKGAAAHGAQLKCITCDHLDFEDHYKVDHEKHAVTYGFHAKKTWLRMAFIQCKQPFTLAHDGRARGYIRARCKCVKSLDVCHWAGVNIPRCEMLQHDETKHCDRHRLNGVPTSEVCHKACQDSIKCSTWQWDTVNSECYHDLCTVPALPNFFKATLTL